MKPSFKSILSFIASASADELRQLKKKVDEQLARASEWPLAAPRNSSPSKESADRINVYTDGASRGNPGRAAIGILITDPAGNTVLEDRYFWGVGTNNESEYRALLAGLAHAQALKARHVSCFSDSQLMVRQMTGQYAIKSDRMRALAAQAKDMARTFESIRYTHLPRENPSIQRVDRLANKALDEN